VNSLCYTVKTYRQTYPGSSYARIILAAVMQFLSILVFVDHLVVKTKRTFTASVDCRVIYISHDFSEKMK